MIDEILAHGITRRIRHSCFRVLDRRESTLDIEQVGVWGGRSGLALSKVCFHCYVGNRQRRTGSKQEGA